VKLLVVSRRYPPDHPSGSETVIANLVEQAGRRHQVRLVAGFQRDRSLVPEDAVAVDLRGARFGAAQLAMWRAAWAQVLRWRPDAVLSNSVEVPRTHVPTALIVHDLNFGRPDRARAVALRHALYRWRARVVRRVVAVSAATRDSLVDIGVHPGRIAVIPNGVDTGHFHPVAEQVRLDDKARGRVVLCYPGRIVPGKGQHLAIDAVARLPEQDRARVLLRIAGVRQDPAYYEQLRVQAFGLPVTLHPDVDDLAPYYQEADLVLFPTLLREGFGYTAVEAMACAKPVVWTEQPAIREATGGLGIPVPEGDSVAICEAIGGYLDDPGAWAEVGAQGRALVVERYAWSEVWRAYEQLLTSL